MKDPFENLYKAAKTSMTTKRKRSSPLKNTQNADFKRLLNLHAQEKQLLRNMQQLSKQFSNIRAEVNKMMSQR
jgi:hypothetical protein